MPDSLALVLRDLEAERDAYREALWWIADHESGIWGVRAREALKPYPGPMKRDRVDQPKEDNE